MSNVKHYKSIQCDEPWTMSYSVHGQMSSRKKSELGLLKQPWIKPFDKWSAWHVWIGNISFFRVNYWGKHWTFCTFCYNSQNLGVVVILWISCFVHHVHHVISSLLLHIPWYPDESFYQLSFFKYFWKALSISCYKARIKLRVRIL